MRYSQDGRRNKNARQMYPVKKAWRIQSARDSNMFPRRPSVRVKPAKMMWSEFLREPEEGR